MYKKRRAVGLHLISIWY